jgi:hypothetical protein
VGLLRGGRREESWIPDARRMARSRSVSVRGSGGFWEDILYGDRDFGKLKVQKGKWVGSGPRRPRRQGCSSVLGGGLTLPGGSRAERSRVIAIETSSDQSSMSFHSVLIFFAR